MIDRYCLPEMGRIWSEEEKIKKWLAVEMCVLEAFSKNGIITAGELAKIRRKIHLNIPRIKKIETTTRHDMAAFVDQISENLGSASRWIHFGLTSSDISDTATALQLKESCGVITRKLLKLMDTVGKLAVRHKNTPMIGRTHGVHAEPITFGFKLSGWYSGINRALALMENTLETVSYGKISGPVGTFAHINPPVEEYVCKKLKLKPEPVSTQIVPRDRYAAYLCLLAIIASTIEGFAVEIRNMQRTEILEVEEEFVRGQKGSSSMPHKRNPVGAEQISGLARVVRSNCLAGLENIAVWGERDISHSSVERIVIPDSSILVDYILHRFNGILENLSVYTENMQANLTKSQDVYFSQLLMLNLIKKGLDRDRAYRTLQDISHRAYLTKKDFKGFVLKDKKVMKYLSEKEIKGCFSMKYFIRNIDIAFRRIGLK
ncbi:MAG: adenylosuccinate lyase [Elusimicrobia bacterium]|nr:adenylosuccinate lyase [Elusimicrobiota bacterium]